MPPYTRRLITPLECYPALLSRVQFEKICVLTLSSHEGSFTFFCLLSFILSPRAACVCAERLWPVCVRMRVRGSNLETVYKHGHVGRTEKPLAQSLLLSDDYKLEREREGVREQMWSLKKDGIHNISTSVPE